MKAMPNALAEMLAHDQANGVNVFDDPAPPRPPGPPISHQPLTRPVFEAPDWRAEEEARARANTTQPAPDELAPPPPQSLDSRPAPPRRKPPATPNLDKVKAWRNGR